MTPKEVCIKASELTYPELSPEGHTAVARAIWEACPTGEIDHVYDLYAMMIEYQGASPDRIPAFVLSLREVDRTAQRFMKSTQQEVITMVDVNTGQPVEFVRDS